MRRLASILAAAAAAAALAAGPAAAAPPAEEHVRGVVAAVSGDSVTVKTAEGRTAKVALAPSTRIGTLTRASLDAIGKDAFVGVSAVRARDGTLRALEVHLFPPSMRGVGEGHHPWDLRPGSTMTNATVASEAAGGTGSGSTMTNANVSGVSGSAAGKTLTLTYAGGEQKVLVAPGTPVVKVEPAGRGVVAPGAHVFAAGPRDADGTVRAGRIFVGEGGVVPPM